MLQMNFIRFLTENMIQIQFNPPVHIKKATLFGWLYDSPGITFDARGRVVSVICSPNFWVTALKELTNDSDRLKTTIDCFNEALKQAKAEFYNQAEHR
jgi:hypothetical protein